MKHYSMNDVYYWIHSGIFAGIGASIVVFIILVTLFVWIYQKKQKSTNTPTILLPSKMDSNHLKSIIFQKGENLKNDVVHATEDEKKIFEEFQTLETRVAESITPVKTTNISREEENVKHNRYKDIGKAFTFDNWNMTFYSLTYLHFSAIWWQLSWTSRETW